jgi:SAM-dependent methyltransferase
MEQTPLRDYYNPNVLSLIPKKAWRVVEVGCGGGTMAREYRKINPYFYYVSIEIVDRYAEAARAHCNRVILGNIERMDDKTFASLPPSSCWIFADVLEHLYDPWGGVAPNRHQLQSGIERDRVHSKCAALERAGAVELRRIPLRRPGAYGPYAHQVVHEDHRRRTVPILWLRDRRSRALMLNEPSHREQALEGVRAFAEAIGANAEEAVENASAFQWLVRAMPRP